jgi:hypothetical protein
MAEPIEAVRKFYWLLREAMRRARLRCYILAKSAD